MDTFLPDYYCKRDHDFWFFAQYCL
jgi:hypothetical protein